MKSIWIKLLSVWGCLLLAGCAANAPQDGACVRSCGSRPIGGGNVKGVALSDAVTFSKCQPGSTLPQVKYRFFIYEDLSGSNAGGTSDSAGTKPGGSNAKFPSRMGKAGVAVEPLVDGFVELDTPPNERCTDSCGFVEIAFTPQCQEQDVSIGVLAPGMTFDGEGAPKTKFSVSFD